MGLLDIFTFRKKTIPESVKNGLPVSEGTGEKVRRFKRQYSSKKHESIKNGFKYDGETFSRSPFKKKNNKDSLVH